MFLQSKKNPKPLTSTLLLDLFSLQFSHSSNSTIDTLQHVVFTICMCNYRYVFGEFYQFQYHAMSNIGHLLIADTIIGASLSITTLLKALNCNYATVLTTELAI